LNQHGFTDKRKTRRPLRSSHDKVVADLGRLIVSGQIGIGENLPGDRELTDSYHVSRTVLREALKTLSAKGLVVAKARIGTRVRPMTEWNFFDADIIDWLFSDGLRQDMLLHISDVRMAFEPQAAALAAVAAPVKCLDELEAFARDLADPDQSAERMAFTDLKFHLAILDASSNPFLRSIGNIIEIALIGFFNVSSPVGDAERLKTVSDAHLKVVDAIRAGDPAGAKAAMEDVITMGKNSIS